MQAKVRLFNERKKPECVIKISVVSGKDYLKLTIEDNGIGRTRASGQSISTGKGLKITGEFYDILNQIKNPVRHTIIDIYNEKDDPSGTRVDVVMPVNQNLYK